VEIGVFTFADLREDASAEQRLRDLLEEIELLGREVAPAVRARITERASGE
jgi:hypothetical protein